VKLEVHIHPCRPLPEREHDKEKGRYKATMREENERSGENEGSAVYPRR